MDRLKQLKQFYALLDRLEAKLLGKRSLADCHGRMEWPARGVYFFFEAGESRSDTGTGPRVVRVGTHALTAKSRTFLWNRLSQHQGIQKTGGGNHRGSIFRLLVGTAMKRRDGLESPESWGIGGDPGKAAGTLGISRKDVKESELPLEIAVSQHIRAMPFLWLDIDDAPGPESLRGIIERNAIALLSNYRRPPLDPPSNGWLGHHADRDRVRRSGLWNNNHVDEAPSPDFLRALEHVIQR